MISKITASISRAIFGEFGEGYNIYTEDTEQELEEPCFFIQCINPKISLFRGKRYLRENQFAIQYFPESKEYRQECLSIIDRLYSALRLIDYEGRRLRGVGVDTIINDGVLTFYINYNIFVDEKPEDIEKMRILIQKETNGNG